MWHHASLVGRKETTAFMTEAFYASGSPALQFASFALLAIKMAGGLKVKSCFPKKYLLSTQGQTYTPLNGDGKLNCMMKLVHQNSKVNSVFLACGLCTRCNWNRTNFTPCNCSHSGVGLVVQNKTLQERCVWRNPKLHANVRQAVRQEQQTDQFASRVAASRFIGALTYLRNIPISLHLQ